MVPEEKKNVIIVPSEMRILVLVEENRTVEISAEWRMIEVPT
jgi:hypothetical protein